MRIFDETKTKEILESEIDNSKYKLEQTTIFKKHHEAIKEVQEQSHYETIAEYPNGGKDVRKVIDVKYVAPKDAWDEYEDILYLVPLTDDEIIDNLRFQREEECFPIINRGQLWYNNLSGDQLQELNEWYRAWLDVTETRVVPTKPSWVGGVK